MELSNQNVLFFTRTMNLGGTENVILQLCELMKNEVGDIIVCSCGGINVKKLNEMGIKHYDIPDIEKKDLRTIVEVLIKVFKLIKTENITFIHTHHRMAAFYTKLLSYFNKFIFINTSHNTFTNKKLLTKFAYKKANLVACGEMVKKNLVDYYNISDKDVTVIHNGIKPFDDDIRVIDILKKYKDSGYFLVGNIGRLAEQKGLEYYIKAANEIKKEVEYVKFFIIGEGEEKEKLQELIKSLGLSEDVILLGYRNDIQNVMSQLDLVVLTSLWEGLPLTPIEAFSVGKTIVATGVDGTIEIVDNDLNGYLVKPKDIDSIARRIKELILDNITKQKFEKNAKIKYDEKFSIKIFNKKYKSYYKQLLIK